MENTIITALNFNKVCRVCLTEYDSMFSIYSELFEDNSDERIPRIYEILTNISSIKVQSDDGLPSMICTKCIDKAHSSYKFQQECNRSQELLDAYVDHLKELVKSEETSEQLQFEKFDLKEEIVQTNEIENEDIFLSPKYVLINDVDLHKSTTEESENIDSKECNDLANCIALGEDTVDRLIKDNLQVDNLEMISPKIRSFNWNLKSKEIVEPIGPKKTLKQPKSKGSKPKEAKEAHNMNYYQKEKENGSMEYECNVCQRRFKFGNSLRIHLKNHDDEKPYVCTECKKGFKSYGSLMHHIRSHSGEQPYECKECGKRYKQSGTLTAHMRIHTGSKPFLCSICGRGFRQAPDLTYHMRTHTKEKPYMCNVCGKTMSMQCHLVQHMRSHTGEKPFKCLDCNKAFPSSTRLKRHSIIHTTLKPYECHICEKSFNRSSSLRVHTKTHLGVRSHICSICNKSFLWAHSLRGHMATHSKETSDKKGSTPTTAVPSMKNANTAIPTSSIKSEKTTGGEVNDMPLFTDPVRKIANKKCFAIYSSKGAIGLDSVAEAFQIYSVEATDQDGLETFTLYSAESNAEHTSTISTAPVKLSAVTL